MTQKRIVALALLLSLALLLAGCKAAPLSASEPETSSGPVGPGILAGSVTPKESGEHMVSLLVDWSEDKKLEGDVTIKVYVNGELDRSKTTVVDASVTSRNFTFSGSGKKNIRVKINNDIFKVYTIDFDTQTVE